MSIWAVNWALHAEVPNATHKLVLIALGNFADDQDQAWPHVDTLTELASTSRRTVFRALEALEAVPHNLDAATCCVQCGGHFCS